MAIVLAVFDAFAHNDDLLRIMTRLVGDDVDLKPVEKAFEATPGDFRTKFTAAVQARLTQLAVPEVFIELPEHPEQLRKADLEALVRPAPHGFLSSYPSKGDLLYQVAKIRQRQEHRPAWIPRLDQGSKPVAPPEADSADIGHDADRSMVVTALPEIGEVTVMLPTPAHERAELVTAAGGIGEWESVLFAVLGLVGDDKPATTVAIDAAANEALVPDEARWWSPEPPQRVPATQDPGVASELLATSATLGGLPVTDNTPEACDVVADALASAGDWRYSPRWLLQTWIPGDETTALAVAQAAVAAWADEHRSGVIMYAYGGAFNPTDGLVDAPRPLHSYLLAVTRSTDSTDTVAAVHRVIRSCPGEHWCHRGGCPDLDHPELDSLLTPIITTAHVSDAALNSTDSGSIDSGWAESHRQLYGDGDGPDYTDRILDVVTGLLTGAGWVELEESTWESGLEQTLLRRGEHCLVAAYDPVTRQLQLTDGRDELDLTLQALAEEGVLIGDDAWESVDTSEAAVEQWGTDLLTAADDLLQGRFNTLPQLTSPVQITMLGLHPHADGTLRGPQAVTLADRQLRALLATIGLLATRET